MVLMQPVYGYGGRTIATFAIPEGMKDCFYIPDPYVDLKDVSHTECHPDSCIAACSAL